MMRMSDLEIVLCLCLPRAMMPSRLCDKKPPVQPPPPAPPPPPPVVQANADAAAATPAADTDAARRRRRRRVPTEDEVFATKTAELNARGPLADVFFDYDKADLTDAARATLQKNARLAAPLDVNSRDDRRATPTRAARTNTTWRSANAARQPCATTWSVSAFPPRASRSSARARKSRSAGKKPSPAGRRTGAGTSW